MGILKNVLRTSDGPLGYSVTPADRDIGSISHFATNRPMLTKTCPAYTADPSVFPTDWSIHVRLSKNKLKTQFFMFLCTNPRYKHNVRPRLGEVFSTNSLPKKWIVQNLRWTMGCWPRCNCGTGSDYGKQKIPATLWVMKKHRVNWYLLKRSRFFWRAGNLCDPSMCPQNYLCGSKLVGEKSKNLILDKKKISGNIMCYEKAPC